MGQAQEISLVTMETSAEECEQYTTGVKESWRLFWGLRKPDRENEHASEVLLSREGSCGMEAV